MQKTVSYRWLSMLLLFLVPLINYSQAQVKKSTFRLLVYGLPNFKKQNAENVIAQKWGIEFYPLAGCIVTPEFVDSVDIQNKKIELLIEKKYGKDWREQFDKEVNTEFELEEKVTTLVNELNYIKSRQADLEKEGNGLHYELTPVVNSTNYKVSAQGWSKWNGKDEWVTYYKFLVNYKTKTVKLLSNKIAKA